MKKAFLIIAVSVTLLCGCDENPNQQHAGPRGNGQHEVIVIQHDTVVINKAFVAADVSSQYNTNQATGFANNMLSNNEKKYLSHLVGNQIGVNHEQLNSGYKSDAITPISLAIDKSNSQKIDSVLIYLKEIREAQKALSQPLNYKKVSEWCKKNDFKLTRDE